MDNVLVDFTSGISKIPKSLKSGYEDRLDEVPGIFSLMELIKGRLSHISNFYKNMIFIFFQLLHGKIQVDGVIKTNG